MATEAPAIASLELVTHTLEDLTQTSDEAEDKYLGDVLHRIKLLHEDLPLHQEGLTQEQDLFWSAFRQFEESGEHVDPKQYIHEKGFQDLVARLQDVQKAMFAKRDAESAPIDPDQTIAAAPKRDQLVDILIDKRVFLPPKNVQAQDLSLIHISEPTRPY